MPPRDSKYVAPNHKEFLLNKVVRWKNRKIVSSLNEYGRRYDNNSFWLEKKDKKSDNDVVLLYIHGGGFFIDALPSSVEGTLAIYELIEPSKKARVSVLMLDYKLASRGHAFPVQLDQLHETYQNLTNDGYKNIILMGDSAGGNLSIGYTQFLKSLSAPKESFPRQLILVSPWVNLLPSHKQNFPGESYYDNHDYDMIQYTTLKEDLLTSILGEKKITDIIFNSILFESRDPQDWKDIPNFNDPEYSVFVITGEDEVFRDDVLRFGETTLDVPLFAKYKYGDSNNKVSEKHVYKRTGVPGHANVAFYIEPWGVHDSVFYMEEVLPQIASGRVKSLADVDKTEYFGTYRIAEFLNQVL